MNKKTIVNSSSTSTSSIPTRKYSFQIQDSPIKTQNLATSSSRKFSSASKVDRNSTLTSIIEEKVSNLKSKFSELNGLRKKLEENKGDYSPNLMKTLRPRIGSIDSKEVTKKPIMSGAIFRTEEKNYRDSELYDQGGLSHRPSFNNYFIDQSPFDGKFEKSSKFEVDDLKAKLKNKEKEVHEMQKSLAVKDAIIIQKDSEIREVTEKYKLLIEINKSLKVHINRIESQMKNLDEKKSTNVKAIKNLSYIILSKDSPSKDSKCEGRTDQGFTLKYIETLYELIVADQLTLNVYEKLKNNQIRDALQALVEVEGNISKRLERTKKYAEELENAVYDCRSPMLTRTESKECRDIGAADFFCFMKCQAGLLEELLCIS